MDKKIRVTIWNEFKGEQENPRIASVYPKGIHNAIADGLAANKMLDIKTATFYMPEHGLDDATLESTDVLIWWAHCLHDDVDDAVVEKVYKRIIDGMGLIVLHSGHASKIFAKICGTPTGDLKWREDGKHERLWVVDPTHPIVDGIDEYIDLPHEETYGEHFNIPAPDELVFIGWFTGGEVFRSGVTFKRGRGKIFYFQPGHETYPIYYQPQILKVIDNAVKWAAPITLPKISYGNWLNTVKDGGGNSGE